MKRLRTFLLAACVGVAMAWPAACSSGGGPLTPAQRELARTHLAAAERDFGAGRLYDAIRNAEASLAIDPLQEEAHELYQDVMLKLEAGGDRAAGNLERRYRELSEDDWPGDPVFIYLHGRVLYRTGRREAGFAQFRRALALDPSNRCAGLRTALADYYRETKKDAAKARKYARLAALIQEKNRLLALIEETSPGTVDIQLHVRYQDVCLAGASDPAILETRYRDLRKQNPGNAAFEYLHGRAVGLAGRLEQARPIFESALKMQPKFPWALDALAVVRLKKIQQQKNSDPKRMLAAIEEAENDLHRAILADDKFVRAYRTLAGLLFQKGVLFPERRTETFKACLQIIDTGLRLAPKDGMLRWHRGNILWSSGAPYLARQEYRKAAEYLDFWREDLRDRAENLARRLSGLKPEALKRSLVFDAEEQMARLNTPGAGPTIRRAALEILISSVQGMRALTTSVPSESGADPELPLNNLLSDRDEIIRKIAIDGLDRWRTRFAAAADRLGEILLGDSSFIVRARAAEALGNFKNKVVCRFLIMSLKDENAHVRQMSVDALRRVSGKNFGFKHNGTEKERTSGLVKWANWWNENRDTLAPKKKPNE